MGDQPQLERGHDGEWVLYLQQCLEHRGIQCGAADGQFGEILENAVKQLQFTHGLTPDGVVDEKTWNALLRDSSQEGSANTETDERVSRFDLNDYPLLHQLAQYGEGEDAAKQFLIARGVDSSFIDAVLAAT